MVKEKTFGGKLNIKVLCLILSICMVFVATPVFAAGSTSLTLSSAGGNPGDAVTVSLSVYNPNSFTSGQLKILYDSTKLELVGVSNGSILNNFSVSKNTTTAGNIRVSFATDSSKAVTTNGVLLSLSFKIKTGIPGGDTPITLAPITDNVGNLPYLEGGTVSTVVTTNGKITINNLSSDANLKSLTCTGYTLTPAFSPSVTSYNVVLPHGTTQAPTVTAVANDTKVKSVTVTPAASPTGSATVVVIAQDGVTSKTYTVNFSVAPSSDATLKTLRYNGISVPGFSANTPDYNVTLPYNTTTAPTITAEATDSGALVDCKPITGTSPWTATIVVTAEDKKTTATYTITFTVEKLMIGDVNEDTNITSADASAILDYLVGNRTLTAKQLAEADAKGDGKVSALDASIILDYVTHRITVIPGQH